MSDRPYRSALYIPASKPRALEKALGLAADVILFDLEDAVAPATKIAARETLKNALGERGSYVPRMRIVRINGLDTEWGRDDARALAVMQCDAVLLPKVGSPTQIDEITNMLPGLPIWAMIETPAGVLNAPKIAAHPAVTGLVMGTNDLAHDLRAHGRAALGAALQMTVLAARAAGIAVLDGVYNAFHDQDGLLAECQEGRALGFDGKTLIHPDQIATANAIFAPTPDELAQARRQIVAFEQAEAAGQGVAVLDGRIVENLHVTSARAILAKADAIAALETS
ncbi:CoA ester lyase [Yoonia sp. BS5-3]|uniref:CoA ester lyase n=1 Tax=Yoonia phaeophyticola TaxID=3137369 RepID=A0ABZ2V6L5_9RHOB